MNMRTLISIFLMAAMIIFTAACNKDNGTGTLQVKLTDAPFPSDLVAEANVTFTKIDARLSGAVQGDPFVVLTEEEVTFNLLDLTNGITANLVNLDVPEGSYDLVRIYIKSANIVLSDGTIFNMFVPSGAQTGIKVFINPEIVVSGGLSAELLLDFDVSQSFVPVGNLTLEGLTGFIFNPVIKATNTSFAGRLTGTVTTDGTTAIEGAQVAVYAADTLNTTTFTDATGKYTVLGLLAGNYKVVVEAEGFVSQTVEDVAIVAGNATKKDFVLELAE
jgi:hypothetical protein